MIYMFQGKRIEEQTVSGKEIKNWVIKNLINYLE